MILGIGTDLTDIRRIEKTLERYGEQFENRIFTSREQKKAKSRKNAGKKTIASTYAKRFAAKEACAKALGTGMAGGVFWRDMGVVNLSSGQPTMRLTGGAAERLRTLVPGGHEAVVHLTITDDFPLAQAFVVIEARAKTSSQE